MYIACVHIWKYIPHVYVCVHKCTYVQVMLLSTCKYVKLVSVLRWTSFSHKKEQIMEVCIILIHLLRDTKYAVLMLCMEWKCCCKHPKLR